MIKNHIIFILFQILFSSSLNGQVDTSLILSKVKLLLFEEFTNEIDNRNQLDSFYFQKIIANKLESSGFKNLIFFNVPLQKIVSITLSDSTTKVIYLSLSRIESYIFGYNTNSGKIYRIVGFENNDFDYLLNNISLYIDEFCEYRNLKKRK